VYLVNPAQFDSFSIYAPAFKPTPAVWNGAFDALSVPGVKAGFDAMSGITTSGVEITAAEETSREQSDFAPSGTGPDLVTSWRNSQDAADVQASEDLHLDFFLSPGALAQPFSVYWVGEWNTSGGYLMDGGTSGASIRRNGGNVTCEAGTDLSTSGEPTNGAPCIVRYIADDVNSSLRIEPDGAAPITASGDSGSGSINGLAIGTDSSLANQWLADIGFCQVMRKPTDGQDARIMQYLRDRFNIVHT